MVNSRDITPEYMQSRYEADTLGSIGIIIPEVKRFVKEEFSISADLTTLWKYIANLNTFSTEIPNIDKRKVTPGNISAVCIYGSTLYRHFPTQFARTRRTWFGLGKSVTETVRTKRKKPNDLDLMVLTKEEVGEELFFPGRENIVKTAGIKSGDYGNYTVEGNLELHFTYRSEEQFLKTFQGGDKLSDAVVKYGLPLVGESNFERIISTISPLQRTPFHEISWDDTGRLNGTITEVDKKVCPKTSQSGRNQTNEVNILQPEHGFINPWEIKIPKIGEKK